MKPTVAIAFDEAWDQSPSGMEFLPLTDKRAQEAMRETRRHPARRPSLVARLIRRIRKAA
jgi:hypothetical protein